MAKTEKEKKEAVMDECESFDWLDAGVSEERRKKIIILEKQIVKLKELCSLAYSSLRLGPSGSCHTLLLKLDALNKGETWPLE